MEFYTLHAVLINQHVMKNQNTKKGSSKRFVSFYNIFTRLKSLKNIDFRQTYSLQSKHNNRKINLCSDTRFRTVGDKLNVLEGLGCSLHSII